MTCLINSTKAIVYSVSIFTLFILGFVFANDVHSQPSQQWVARYDNGNPSFPNDYTTIAFLVSEVYTKTMIVDVSGNVYITGRGKVSPGGGGTMIDYITVKYNSSGVQQWVAVYDGGSTDVATGIGVDGSGNVYVTGYSFNGTNDDYITVKYNSSGVQQWVRQYIGLGSYDVATSISVNAAGDVAVTGFSYGTGGIGGSLEDYATVKYNSAGVQQFAVRYNGTGTSGFVMDYAYSCAIDVSGYVYVTGKSAGATTSYDCVTIMYSPTGIQTWLNRYHGGSGEDQGLTVKVDISGNVYVCGRVWNSTTNFDYLTIKYNPSGIQQWASQYVNPGSDGALDLTYDASGNVYVTGESDGPGIFDYVTVKYNSTGVQQWFARYDGYRGYAVAADASGNVYVTGRSSYSPPDYATLKYNATGVLRWVVTYNGPGDATDEATNIALDGSGNIIVGGQSVGSGTGYDYATIKYSQSTFSDLFYLY